MSEEFNAVKVKVSKPGEHVPPTGTVETGTVRRTDGIATDALLCVEFGFTLPFLYMNNYFIVFEFGGNDVS